MKRAHSKLIEAFLSNINKGFVTGIEGTTGPNILRQVGDALKEILGGEKPDSALEVKRVPGGQGQDRNFVVAYIIRDQRKAEKVAVAHFYANKWLKENGYKTLSDKRLREIYKQHKARIKQMEIYIEMVKMLERDSPKTE